MSRLLAAVTRFFDGVPVKRVHPVELVFLLVVSFVFVLILSLFMPALRTDPGAFGAAYIGSASGSFLAASGLRFRTHPKQALAVLAFLLVSLTIVSALVRALFGN